MTKDEVAALKESLKADLQAIERVERLLAEREKGARTPATTKSVITESANAIPEEAQTLKATVEATARSFGNASWTVKDIVQKLTDAHFQFDATDPYKTVHATLWKLEKGGIIRTVVRGRGRRPNTYQTVLGQQSGASEGNDLFGRTQ